MQSATRFRAPSAALALFTAGNAYAVDLKGTGKYATVDTTLTTSAAVKLAEELRFSSTATTTTALRSTDVVTFHVQASAGNSLPNDVPLLLTLDLTNAIFNEGATAGSVVSATGGCVATPSPLNGVQANAKSASYLLTLSGCTASAGAGLDISLPIRVTGAGPVSIGAELATQAGNLPVDGGRKAATFIQLAKAFDVAVSTTRAFCDLIESRGIPKARGF